MEANQNLLSTELQIDNTGHAYLAETAKWATFLSILGFIGSSILILIAIFSSISSSNFNNGYENQTSAPLVSSVTIRIIWLVGAVIWIFMSLFLFRFAAKMKAALYSNDQDVLNNSFLNLKNLYKLTGIVSIVYMALVILLVIFGVGAALMR